MLKQEVLMMCMDRKGLDAGWEVRLNGSVTDTLPLVKRRTEMSQFYCLFRLLKDEEHLLK